METEDLKRLFTENLASCPVLAILRGVTPGEVREICTILAETGIRLLEIPLNTPDALKSIALARTCAAPGQLVGAGTVLTAASVRAVERAGGQFIVSPNTDSAVITETKGQGLLSIPGCFTVTECLTAQNAGADFLKFFPAGSVGASCIRDIKAVVKLPFLAVGGVNADNMADFMKVCVGVGVGGALYKAGKTLTEVRRDAAHLAAAAVRR